MDHRFSPFGLVLALALALPIGIPSSASGQDEEEVWGDEEEEGEADPQMDDEATYEAYKAELEGESPSEELDAWVHYLEAYPESQYRLEIERRMTALGEDDDLLEEDGGDEAEGEGSQEAPADARGRVDGSIGAVGMFGLYFGEALDAEGGNGRWVDFGGGLEVGLGARSGRLQGRLRIAYQGVADEAGELRHNGIFSAGLAIQLRKDPLAPLGVYVPLDVGVSPLVTELRVFVFAHGGIGVRYQVGDRLELFGEITALLRFEKALSAGPLLTVGARFRL